MELLFLDQVYQAQLSGKKQFYKEKYQNVISIVKAMTICKADYDTVM